MQEPLALKLRPKTIDDIIGQEHLVGENGPELRVLNSGDGIIPNNLTNKLLSMA